MYLLVEFSWFMNRGIWWTGVAGPQHSAQLPTTVRSLPQTTSSGGLFPRPSSHRTTKRHVLLHDFCSGGYLGERDSKSKRQMLLPASARKGGGTGNIYSIQLPGESGPGTDRWVG